MREMHKWKDKVELSLDNRQIFFLFFGLSVIGCFVFALGIMTGRRLQWEPGQEVASLGREDSLAMLEDDDTDERFAFRSGLSESDAEGLPATRDPELPPRAEAEVKAERLAAGPTGDSKAERVEQQKAQVAEVEATLAEQQKALAQAVPQAAKPAPAAAKPAAAVTPEAKPAPEPKPAPASRPENAAGRAFTLQMKAFSREEDATKLANKLRSNGHEVRVESHEVRGRTWHRVRLGEFKTWEEALAAKQAFEKAEQVIAYVVSV
jgi:cell division septation protein DedD